MKTDYLKPLTIGMPLLIAFHYYLSYQVLFKYLDQFDLSRSGIITFEDILFHFGDVSQVIIKMASTGFLMVLIMRLIIPEKTYSALDKFLVPDKKLFVNNFFSLIIGKEDKIFKIIVISLITLGLSILSYLIIKASVDINFTPLIATFLVLSVLMPLVYLVWASKRYLIFFLTFLITVNFSNLLIDEVIKETSNSYSYNTIVEFDYENKSYRTDDNLQVIYEGYKYIVVRNESDCSNFLFERNLIANFKKKLIDFK